MLSRIRGERLQDADLATARPATSRQGGGAVQPSHPASRNSFPSAPQGTRTQNVWTAPSRSQPDQLYVYIRFAKVKLNSPGCLQAHRDLDNNTFETDHPTQAERVDADIEGWPRNDFRETCETFSANYLQKPGADSCPEMSTWNAALWGSNPAYTAFWSGTAADWHGVS